MPMSNYCCDVFSELKLLFKPFIDSLIEKLIEVYVQSILLDVNESTAKPENTAFISTSFTCIFIIPVPLAAVPCIIHVVSDTV